jgi:hypothetical protein
MIIIRIEVEVEEMAQSEVHDLLVQMLKAQRSEADIRAAIEHRLPPGCKLRSWVEKCATVGEMRRCGEITGCDDPSNNSGVTCGACYQP